MHTADLPALGHVEAIVIDGPDARRFAQGQFAGDVAALAPGHWQWNAWLTVQGRTQALMHLVDRGDDRLLAVLRGGDAGATRDDLARYLLRSKATITVQTFAASAAGAQAAGSVETGAGGLSLGYGGRSLRLDPLTATAATAIDTPASAAWRLADIRAGWPSLPADAEPKLLPPALGLERLGAVAFEKGCYRGQEIAARLHFRGGHKYRLCHLQGPAPLPAGDIRGANEGHVATILDSVRGHERCDALAVIGTGHDIEINILHNTYRIIRTFQP